MTRKPRLTEEDRQLWQVYAAQIARLPGRPAPALPAPPPARTPEASVTAAPLPASAKRAVRVPSARLAIGDNPGGLDRATWQRLRGGKLAPTRTLDLHGRTAERAFHALAAFLRTAHADGQRCVEVITGRGTGETGGVIRREFPHWLNRPDLRPLVLAASHPHPANPGSVRILLRRPRMQSP
jgi:DNA-nicking Smr family endonuclease